VTKHAQNRVGFSGLRASHDRRWRERRELLQGKRGSVHKRPKVAATNPGGLKGLLTHGNTRDAGMAIYPSLEDASFTHLTGPQKVAKRAQRRSSRGSVVSY